MDTPEFTASQMYVRSLFRGIHDSLYALIQAGSVRFHTKCLHQVLWVDMAWQAMLRC